MIKVIVAVLMIFSVPAGILWNWARKRARKSDYQLPDSASYLLYNYVPFYRMLSIADRQRFEERMRDFLARTKVTGIGVKVYAIDLVFVAACAVIPLFGYPDARYNNLDEVLLYNDSFNKEYDTEGPGRNILGMVGDGHLQRQMLLSQPALRAGFLHTEDASNTGIHEFVHLIDKADGAIDGIPGYFLSKEVQNQWTTTMAEYMQSIQQGITDINPYGATNAGEFLAVISEYYFKQPLLFRQQYPDLYALLGKMYKIDGNGNYFLA